MVIGALGYLAVDSCNLVLQSRELKHTQKFIDGLKACGIEAYAVAAELSDRNVVKEMLETIDNNGTQIDIVLNNAAVQIAYRTDYLKTPAEDYEKSFLINTIAPMMI